MSLRFDRWSLVAGATVLAGLGLRVAASFPLHKYPADADALLAGLCGQAVLDGAMPVFFAPLRIGSGECYLAAPLLAVFGPSRLPLTLAALMVAAATLLVARRFFAAFLMPPVAALALLFLAIPPPAVLFWTYMLNGYPTLLLLCLTILWQALRAARRTLDVRTGLGLGLISGIALWHSFLTLGCSLPAIVWLLWRRRSDLPRARGFALAAVAGALLGAAPWMAFNVRYDFPSLTSSFATRPAGSANTVLANAEYFVRYSVPELLASIDLESLPDREPRLLRGLRPVVLALYAVAAFAVGVRLVTRPHEGTGTDPGAWQLLFGVAAAVTALNLFSEAGALRGLTVRYLLPLVLVAVPALALWTYGLRRRSRLGSAAVAVLVLAFNLAVSWHDLLPAARRRGDLRVLAGDDARLLASLEQHGVGLVLGSFWMVYPLTFFSGERMIGVPCEPGQDPYDLRRRLARQGVPERWALVAAQRSGTKLTRWAAAAGLEGILVTTGPYVALFPSNLPPSPDAAFLDRTLARCADIPGLGP